MLTSPFNNFFRDFKKKWSVAVSIIHRQSWADHRQIIGRSWADHGRSIHAEKSWKFQLFPIPFFLPKNYGNLRFSHSVWTKRLVIFADPVIVSICTNTFSLSLQRALISPRTSPTLAPQSSRWWTLVHSISSASCVFTVANSLTYPGTLKMRSRSRSCHLSLS